MVERQAYIVCKAEDKDRSIRVLPVPERYADTIAERLRRIPETFNQVTVVKVPPEEELESAGIA